MVVDDWRVAGGAAASGSMQRLYSLALILQRISG